MRSAFRAAAALAAALMVPICSCAFSTAAFGSIIYQSTDQNVAIGDGTSNGIPGVPGILDIVITDDATILDLNVGIVITHTFQGDLSVMLTHVGSGISVTLVNRPGVTNPAMPTNFGYSADNYGNFATTTFMIFDDQAANNSYNTPALGGSGPSNSIGIVDVTGSWKPASGSLAAFNGMSTAGVWRLTAIDWAQGDIGAIRGMQLTFEVPAPAALALFGLPCVVGTGRRRRN